MSADINSGANPETARPVTLLIAALGGEGGGVLTNWVVSAAESSGLVVQSTSIPGVAQRTGATTYYLEIFPVPEADLGGRKPILALVPTVGDIDVMIASEIVEAARAIQLGYVTPDRTTLIASNHRIFAIGERGAMADGRFDIDTLQEAATAQSAGAYLSDFRAMAEAEGTVINAVLLGVIAGTGKLPISAEGFANAIRAEGKAVDANIRGFEAGLAYAKQGPTVSAPPADAKRRRKPSGADVEARVAAEFPEAVHDILTEGVRRLVDYQNPAYAARYLDRLGLIRDADSGTDVLRETARHLALRLSYEDIIRVAQLKTKPDRYNRVVEEIRADQNDPVQVTEFFKPGIEEVCSILPPSLAEPLMRTSEKRGWLNRAYLGLHVKSTTVNGFFRIWLLSKLRRWRPRTWRYREEQRWIDEWLGFVEAALKLDTGFAYEVAQLARLIKGYGDTWHRGAGNYRRIVEAVVQPALAGDMSPHRASDALANARTAASADPSGGQLGGVLDSIAAAPVREAAE